MLRTYGLDLVYPLELDFSPTFNIIVVRTDGKVFEILKVPDTTGSQEMRAGVNKIIYLAYSKTKNLASACTSLWKKEDSEWIN